MALALNQTFTSTFAVATLSMVLAACGGNEGVVSVSKESNNLDVTSTAASFNQSLAQAHIPVLASRCFATDPAQLPGDRVSAGGFPSMLYEFDVPSSKASEAEGLGFMRNSGRPGFAATSVPCTSLEDVKPMGMPVR